jgi:SAM-dependent methyltransferase
VSREPLLNSVERYYSAKVTEHGAVPAGVDWNGAESQDRRFRELLKICDPHRPFSINDIGCGYGALVPVLERDGYDFVYQGYDISSRMLDLARVTLGESDQWSFVDDEAKLAPADYSVASGIFNVKLGADEESWSAYVLSTINRLNDLSVRGFAFNMLTSYSDPKRMRPDLHYANPAFVFDHCKRHYSREVALLHDYGLWEFTVLVRLEPIP